MPSDFRRDTCEAKTLRRLTDWIWEAAPASSAHEPTIVLVPYAGGGAHSLIEWAEQLGPSARILTIQYPGRGARAREPSPGSVQAIVTAVSDALVEVCPGPLVFVGHSMGAIVAFELAWTLECRQRDVALLAVSSARPPHLGREDFHEIYELPTEELISALRASGGIPDDALAFPELLELMAPVLRHDFRLLSNYDYGPVRRRVKCPIVAMCGDSDRGVTPVQARSWAELTQALFDLQVFPGGHFFYREHLPKIARMLTTRLVS